MVSIVVPIYNEAENIKLLVNKIQEHVTHNHEIIFVDDGSSDNSLQIIEAISIEYLNIKCLSLSRNFGHQNALMAGISNALGEVIVIMDCDLQHPPSLIPVMIDRVEEGFDIVNTKRNKTEEIGYVKNGLSIFYYKFLNAISDVKIEANVADFKAFNQRVREALLQFEERDLFLRGIFSWIGYKATTLEFNAPKRLHGKSKYSFLKMFRLGLRGITSFSFKPLRMALFAGCIISIAAFIFAIFAWVAYYQGRTVPGWASLIIAIMFLGGTQLLSIGLLGEYIASLFTETKKRPLYLVAKKINF